MSYEKIKHDLSRVLSYNDTVGFLVSGGFDSALLLYICCMIKVQQGLSTKFEIFTVPRYDDSQRHAQRVVDFVSLKHGINLPIFIVGDPSLHHSQQVMSGIAPSLERSRCVLLADTSNPDVLSNGPVRIRSDHPAIIQPFFDFTKKDTVALAMEFGIVDDIAIVSHTCTESVELRCSRCWQCQERAWGFSQNDYIDLGKM